MKSEIDIREVQIGTRKLRTIKLYPLSFRDQARTAEVLRSVMQSSMSAATGGSDLNFIVTVVKMLLNHAEEILDGVLDPEEKGEDILAEIDNNQLMEVVRNVYEVNFEGLEHRLKALISPVLPDGRKQRLESD